MAPDLRRAARRGESYGGTTFKGSRRVALLASHTIHTFAGTGAGGFTDDGGTAAGGELAQPAGVAENDAYPHPLVGSMVVYVADTANNRVRAVFIPAVTIAP